MCRALVRQNLQVVSFKANIGGQGGQGFRSPSAQSAFLNLDMAQGAVQDDRSESDLTVQHPWIPAPRFHGDKFRAMPHPTALDAASSAA